MKLLIGGILLAVAACEPSGVGPLAIDPQLGERSYQKCYSCHALEPGKNDLTGPTLFRIVGRSVAAEPGYGYSPALRSLAQVEPRWTKALLDRFVRNPESLAPGTSMMFHGIDDPVERAALIAFLERGQTSASAASLP